MLLREDLQVNLFINVKVKLAGTEKTNGERTNQEYKKDNNSYWGFGWFVVLSVLFNGINVKLLFHFFDLKGVALFLSIHWLTGMIFNSPCSITDSGRNAIN